MASVQNAPVNDAQFNWKPKFFPFNLSLEDELNRLFSEFCLSHVPTRPTQNDVWDDFKQNGRDYEYCSDQEDSAIARQHNRKKNRKPLPTECVFCKNNGEDAKIYKKHLLKDVEGRTVCPILRRYTCPICGAKGDNAHTLKYCPLNKQNHSVAPTNALKTLRNSTGRRRSK